MYALWRNYDVTLRDYASSAAIQTGPNQSNLMAVVANDSTFDLYVNHHKIDSVSDSTYSKGEIGVEADYRTGEKKLPDQTGPTEVVFSDARVWTE